mgnify:CR=1 FL=1
MSPMRTLAAAHPVWQRLVPFINRFPRDTKLYALMTTKPGEGVFGGEEVPV